MSEATQQELGEMLHPSGSQAGDALSNTHSEPGRSWIRPLVFVALAMAMTTQALMTSWISASVPRKSNHCELKVFNDMELSSATFYTVCAWLNIGVNFVPTVLAGYYLIKNTTRLGSRLSFDWYSAFMLSIVGTLCCSMAYQWKRVQKDFSNQPGAALLFWSFLHICFLGVQGAFLGYLNSTATKNNHSGLPCKVWAFAICSLGTLLVQLCLVFFMCNSLLILLCRLASQIFTTLAEYQAYQKIRHRIENARPPTDFTAFERSALSSITMLIFINFSEWMEQFVLAMRGIFPELYEVDVEIAVLLAVINTTVPLLYIVLQTPNWNCGGSRSTLGKSMPLFCHFLLWIFFVIYLVWGCHMTCFPSDLEKANDGGWFFVIAKTSAATFYLDIPILFIVLLDGAFMLMLTSMGLYVPRDDVGYIHRCVGCRLIFMAMAHSLAHVIWIGKDGLYEYCQRVWQNDFWPQLPFWTGVLMLLSVVLTLPAYCFCKKKRYATFLFLKRSSSMVFIFFGLFHGDAAALGHPTLFACLLLVIVYFGLDQGVLA